MVSGGIKPAEPYAVMSFITMVTDIVESPLRNSDGSGSMLMIRIPNRKLGKRFHDVLKNTRDRYSNNQFIIVFPFQKFCMNVLTFAMKQNLLLHILVLDWNVVLMLSLMMGSTNLKLQSIS